MEENEKKVTDEVTSQENVQREAELSKEENQVKAQPESEQLEKEDEEQMANSLPEGQVGQEAEAKVEVEEKETPEDEPAPQPSDSAELPEPAGSEELAEDHSESALPSVDERTKESEEATATHSSDSEEEKSEEAEVDAGDSSTQENSTEERKNPIDEIKLDEASKADLLGTFKLFNNEEDMRWVDRAIKEIKPAYDKLYSAERETAKEKFLAIEGNEEADFQFLGDDVDRQFFAAYEMLRTRRKKYYANLEKEKDHNYQLKTALLDRIRVLVDGEESNTSIESIKELQAEWKKIGPVPGQHNKTLWANYNALLDRFYDNRSIYFELKELDRKKNLESKIELCVKAEALDAESDLKKAIHDLNELHDEYKHIGPVPKDDQEALWQRFKAASDAVYAKRKDFYDHLKEELSENMVRKRALGERLVQFAAFNSDRINEWNKKTKEILAVQKEWDAIGGVPREYSKEVNKSFWSNFKKFFANKNQFFKKLEGEREENLKAKQELIKKAESLKESEDWDRTANDLKRLQQEWRSIGPVPEKFRNEIYDQFKGACDYFFNRKRGGGAEQSKEFEENLTKKEEICSMLDAYLNNDTIELDEINDLLDRYADVGYVPKESIEKIHQRFDAITEKLLAIEELSAEQRADLEMKIQINRLKNSPHGGQKIQRKENAIRRKIQSIENDINNWKTNMGFFAESKNATQLKDDFQQKIEEAEKELDTLRLQLKVLSRV